jgi:ABC-2 type transport system permease protein
MAAHSALLPVNEKGWRRGFANLLSKENGAWWRTRTWLVQTIVWVAILDGILATILFAVPKTSARIDPQNAAVAEAMESMASKSTNGLMVFTIMGLMALATGMVIAAQEAIIDEKKSGTAAWILSKPVSRASFILAKLIAHGLGMLVAGVIVPGAIAFVMLSAAGGPISLGSFVPVLGMLFLNVLFYLTLTLMLGTLFDGRGPVIGIPLALVYGYQFFTGLAPWLNNITPWGFLAQTAGPNPTIAQVGLGQAALPLAPIVATALWCVLFIAVALWRFNREEF